ncbi:RhoGAP domain-containing protein [Heterostelium album PN500]|uniref:RhoGAP domain-containing protein n=1 Tax=Heterostelium pallidum (strain ATCC 26659 / Pp 5 / PN500) TaxID=670386 RepID=D3BEA3_HETP5|nr:RhoGAP domain-containing protein [Heterostelium album PN500]EFA80234.1 RhoGAP domain-containing protein [Heterostelium album PN500]|eukprot:XP_020432354.1 RhoGAP domain-containing protein [Heterostelium album PN500]
MFKIFGGMNRITDHTSLMDELQKNLEKQQQHFFATSQHSKTISESLRKYSETSSGFNSRIPLSDCMQRATEWQNTMSDCFNHLGNVLYDRTTQPLKETIRIQLEMVKEAKKRLKKMAPENQSSSSKIDFRKETEAYERAAKETVQLYNDSELALENSAVQTILSAYEAYYDFFQKGAFQMARIKVDIDNYRKIILETNKVAAKLRNYIPRKTFGIKLEEVFAREAHRSIPMFLEEIFKYLEKNAPSVEGIFRISAGKSAIEALQQKIETNQPLDLHTILDTHVVSSVLKSFFRSLPEPLIYYSNYQKYLSLSSQPQNTHITELKRLISSLPVANQIVLKNVFALCNTIKHHKDVTKMDLNNLAVVIAPNLMESIPNLKAEDIQKPETFAEFNSLFILLVENHQYIFPSQSNQDLSASRIRAQTESAVSKPLPATPLKSSTANMSPTLTSVSTTPTSTSTPNLQQEVATDSTPHAIPVSSPTIPTALTATTNNNNNNVQTPPDHQQNNNESSNTPTVFSPSTTLLNELDQDTATVITPPRFSSPMDKKKKSILLTRDDGDILKPIDMQIHFMNINSNFTKLKTIVENIKTTEEGIYLIKLSKKISDISSIIQRITKYSFKRDKPTVHIDDDKIAKAKKTLIYTHDNNIDLIEDAKIIYETCENIDICKELEEHIEQLDAILISEIDIITRQSS